MVQTYTRKEVGRILGVEESRLRYWERLRLTRPRARWGERFYSFSDLSSLQTLQRLTEKNVPASRVRRAISLIEEEFDTAPLRLNELRAIERGGEILIVPPGDSRPFDPVRRQWGFAFEAPAHRANIRAMTARTPEELFEEALKFESRPEFLPDAADNYRRVVEAAPNWIEAHINLGVTLYQMGMSEDARHAFLSAVKLDPVNAISRYNLGCVLEEQGKFREAIEHLIIAVRAMPEHEDVHFNLALAYEKNGEFERASDEWSQYLRLAPMGPWADQARAHLKICTTPRKPSAPIPFPTKTSKSTSA